MLKQSITKNSAILGAFALCTAVIIAGTFQATESTIKEAEKAAEEKALLDIVPQTRHDNDMLQSTLPLSQEAVTQLNLEAENAVVHIAKQGDKVVAFILQSIAPDGYSGQIKLLVGIDLDGSIAGVRVLQHRETPGLGDKIELAKSDWLLAFDGKSLGNPEADGWDVKKNGGEFDQLTGATITPRAVIRQIKKTLALYAQQKNDWLTHVEQANP